ncbi:nuclear transport factor 2 family protein [Nocardia amamiensis]
MERAIMDIFRLDDGKLAEHWDVLQDIPTEALNQNGIF